MLLPTATTTTTTTKANTTRAHCVQQPWRSGGLCCRQSGPYLLVSRETQINNEALGHCCRRAAGPYGGGCCLSWRVSHPVTQSVRQSARYCRRAEKRTAGRLAGLQACTRSGGGRYVARCGRKHRGWSLAAFIGLGRLEVHPLQHLSCVRSHER
jgi:hypothetical protein